jgi:putative flippase GtrA
MLASGVPGHTPMAIGLKRFFRYNMIGLLGLGLKFCVLAILVEVAHFRPITATLIAVEATILHNFSWHTYWTWGDRSTGIPLSKVLTRFLRFQCCNGAVGLLVNASLVHSLVDVFGLHYFIANVAATLMAGLASFLLSEFFVFTPVRLPDLGPMEANSRT